MARLLAVAAAFALLAPAAVAVPIIGTRTSDTTWAFLGVAHAGSEDEWTEFSPGLRLCFFALTDMALHASFTPLDAADRLTLRLLVIEDRRIVERSYVLTAAAPTLDLTFTSPDDCPHFTMVGTQVAAAAPYLVQTEMVF